MRPPAPGSRPGILFLIETVGLGGSERAMANIALAAAGEGYRVAAGVGDVGWLHDHLSANGVPVTIFPEIADARGLSVRGFLRLLALARRRRAGAISTFSFQMHVYGCLAGQLLRRPCVVNLRNAHGDLTTARRRRLWRYFVVPASARITAVSAAARDALVACAPAAAGRVAIIRNGVDLAALAPTRSPAEVRASLGLGDGPVVGAVGRVQPVKRHADLIEAAALLGGRFPGLQVIVAGWQFEPECADLRARAQRLGIAGRVHFLGERGDVADLLQIMDVYVQSSQSEGMSNALLEAMAAGRPVVATRVGGTAEVVGDEETGILVPARQPARLAEAVASLLSDPGRARRMGESARRRVRESFSLERMLARHLAIYRGLLAARAGLPRAQRAAPPAE